jgi:hypothetical protein
MFNRFKIFTSTLNSMLMNTTQILHLYLELFNQKKNTQQQQ